MASAVQAAVLPCSSDGTMNVSGFISSPDVASCKPGSRSVRIQQACASAETSRQIGSNSVHQWQWQPLPQSDEQTILRVERVLLWNLSTAQQFHFVTQRLGLKSPVLLEIMRAGTLLTSVVVED